MNCSYKLLKDAHIGMGVRMSSDNNTIPFANEPMVGMKIEGYSRLGFRISHENMGKTIWVKFEQLPLNDLTMINGAIQDEITFVENIIAHQMELIKTDNPEYQELLKMKEEEKFETFTTLAHTQPGEVVVSALCKEGIAMVYLGTWYTKNIHRDHSWGYGSSDVDKFYLTLNSPQRAFFIVDSEDLTSEEDEIMKQIKQDKIERQPNEDWNDFYKRQDVVRNKYWAEQKVKKAELLAAGGERFKIISYPISSKRVKKLVETQVFNDKFTDLEYNKELILNVSARRDGDHYGKRGEQQQLAELGHEYPRVPMKDFLITNAYYTLSDVDYMTDDKNDINKKAYKFINAHFRCRLQPKLYKGGYRNGEYIDFDF